MVRIAILHSSCATGNRASLCLLGATRRRKLHSHPLKGPPGSALAARPRGSAVPRQHKMCQQAAVAAEAPPAWRSHHRHRRRRAVASRAAQGRRMARARAAAPRYASYAGMGRSTLPVRGAALPHFVPPQANVSRIGRPGGGGRPMNAATPLGPRSRSPGGRGGSWVPGQRGAPASRTPEVPPAPRRPARLRRRRLSAGTILASADCQARLALCRGVPP